MFVLIYQVIQFLSTTFFESLVRKIFGLQTCCEDTLIFVDFLSMFLGIYLSVKREKTLG